MTEHSQFRLLTQRRFLPFFLTQFFGAANDNVFKFAFTVLATYSAAEWGGLDATVAGPVIGGIFILPFVLLSATAGQIADKFEKSRLIRFVKNLEIAIMVAVGIGFLTQTVTLLYAGVFLMGVHSTLFGPVKYAYLPQHLAEAELVGGNAMVEMGTFVAILLGTMTGGILIGNPRYGPASVAGVSVALAIVGRLTAGFVPPTPPLDTRLTINWNPISETIANLRDARANRILMLSMLGISWLWFVGSVFITTFTAFGKDNLGGTETAVTVLLAVFSIGVGIGSLLCEGPSGHKVEIGLVPFGSIGMTAFAVDLWHSARDLLPAHEAGLRAFLAAPMHLHILGDIFLLAVFSGFYSVPLYALIQSRCEPSHRARIIAANNILNALFMVAAALITTILLRAGLSLPQLYLVLGLLNAAVAIYIYTLVPEFLMRFIVWMLIHSIYRLKKSGLENIPDDGPALLVCNHVSYVDALVIAAACPRPVRFVMDHRIFKIPILSFVFRTGKAIPIAPAREDKAMMERAFEEVAQALRNGDLVVIFPEGRLSDNGELSSFRPGITRILERTPVPVIPMALTGLWDSVFSRQGKADLFTHWTLTPFRKIGLAVGAPVAVDAATPQHLEAEVRRLRGPLK